MATRKRSPRDVIESEDNNYSEEFSDDENEEIEENISLCSKMNLRSSGKHSLEIKNLPHIRLESKSPVWSKTPNSSQSESKKASPQFSINWLFGVGLLILGLFLFGIMNINLPKISSVCGLENFMESKLCSQQKSSCKTILRGINTISMNLKIFVLLAHSSERYKAECLSIEIANMSSCILKTTKSLVLTPKGLSYNTDEIINKFKPEIETYKSVIFSDLLNLNVAALISLHNFCDIYNPLVKPVIYTIIIISDDPFEYDNSQNITKTVNNLLQKKFNGNMNKNKIGPLITRITDGPIVPIIPGKFSERCSFSDDKFILY